MRFVHLHTHSHYSLLDGLAKIDDLINRAKNLEMKSLALTDHGNLYGAIEFYKKALKAEIKPILGIEAYIAKGSRHDKQNKILEEPSPMKTKNGEKNYFHLVLLAENNIGWKNLLQLTTKSHLEGFYYKPRMDKELLRQHHEGIIALSACLAGEIPQLILNNKTEEAENVIKEYQNIFGEENFFLEIGHHPNIPEIAKVNEELKKLSQKTGAPLVATQDIHYIKSEDAEYQDVLLAVQTGNKVENENRLSMKIDDFSMRSQEQMNDFFKDTPSAIENTAKIAERCNVNLSLHQILLPEFSLPEKEKSAVEYLKKLTTEKITRRFPTADAKIMERLDYELKVIEKTGFADYFLIVQDFVNWAKERGIVVGPGRGSAAGSLVSYILNITDIDPLKYDLLFERFLNPDRISMPDIDLDFTDARRDEVFAYIREKYGEERTAQIITFGTMAARAAIRDAGRALGQPYSLCDQLAKMIPFNEKLEGALNKIPELKQFYENNANAKKIIDSAKHLEGVARHASVHACGLVISKNPLTEHVPLQRSPQDPNITITQFEMHSIEDLGILKIDLLGLKNLTIIEETIRLIKDLREEEIEISKIPLDDKKTFKSLQEGNTTGVFQLESSGMRRYLKELKPTEFEDIIAMVALYRPGPMELIPSFIKRKHGQEKVKYLHPALEPILKNTYGIGIYQEQMMRIARDLAGFTLAEADTLRKAIGKKIKVLLDSQKEKLIRGIIKGGINPKIAEQIWELFPPFARYGFNRSHAACYAMIGYQTAYLKTHYPIEFVTALFNSDSGDLERIAFLIHEAQKNNIKILPPDINKSFVNFIPEEKNIRFGLLAIKNVGANIVDAIIQERQIAGPFIDFNNFLTRILHKDLNKKSMESLIKAGAFDSLGADRGLLLNNIEEILAFSQNVKKGRNGNNQGSQNSLFGESYSGLRFLSPHASSKKTENNIKNNSISNKERLLWEKELLGLYISGHPLDQYIGKINSDNVKTIKRIMENKNFNGNESRIIGVISKIKKLITKTGQTILFVEIEDKNNSMEIIVFNDAFAKNPAIWQENKIILISGKLSWRNNEPKFICNQATEL